MKNLFVLHTQYNLILASGLCLTQFKGDSNDLILFQDFELKELLYKKLEIIFERCMKLDGNYPKKVLSSYQKYNKMACDNKKIAKFISSSYDRVFVVDDMCIQEMCVLKYATKMNSQVEMSWLEDGGVAYFNNGVISSGMGSTSVKRFIRKVLFSSMFGLWKYYDLANCMGNHKMLRKIYLTFPNVARKEYEGKVRCEISQDAFKQGMKVLFEEEPIFFEENSLLIAMDKIDVYGENIDKVNDLIFEEVMGAKERGQTIYYKYHPRETEQLPALFSAIELDRTIALEKYLTNSNVKTITVLGIKSTALQTAQKMGYKAVSLIKQVEKNAQPVVEFYKKIGVECK